MNRQTTLIILFALLLAATGFVWFRYSGGLPLAEEPPKGDLAARPRELRRLKTIQLDTSILRSPVFQSLSFPVPPGGIAPASASQPGRVNPFAPF